jgi:hypothetical protein
MLAGATAEVKDTLARLGVEQGEHVLAQAGDEARPRLVGVGVPAGRWRRSIHRLDQRPRVRYSGRRAS